MTQGFVKVTRLRHSYIGICSCKVASKAAFLRQVSGERLILRKACEARNG